MEINSLPSLPASTNGVVFINDLGMYISANVSQGLIDLSACRKLEEAAKEFDKALCSLPKPVYETVMRDSVEIINWSISSKIERLLKNYKETTEALILLKQEYERNTENE